MHIRLAVLVFCTSFVDQLLSSPHFWSVPLFKTKVSVYRTRRKLSSPTPPENYCRKDLCPPNVQHIACDNPFWGPECTKPRAGVNMDKIKTKIEDLHNNYRAKLSVSGLGKLPLAKGLPKIHWNEELSILAMRITNFCNDEEASKCVNTPHFLHVARNSFYHETTNSSKNISPENFILETIKYWGDYYKCFDPNHVEKFPPDALEDELEFANIINQKVRFVGCGMLIRNPGLSPFYYVTCLYNDKVKPGQKLYD
ncbi:venom allergen 5-like [Drosophila sulfurigaster albostrigata]|uniref:venom allergen 5-like n=1 Tax=Drosophila sulfurigaster albostrigata TaxID=89887 RepID=UPI002D218381|nr:venom allergen 5-like [Drosophila sulfurigaster albostrigata]